MINYNYGDIILVQFPFSNIFSTKKRPAVIISNSHFNKIKSDIIIMAITSNSANQSEGDSVIHNWKSAGLLKKSYIKPAITTLENKLVIKHLGKLSGGDLENMKIALKKLLNL